MKFPGSQPGPNPARASETPTANRFKNTEQPAHHQHEADPQLKIRHDDPGDEQDRAEHAADQPAGEADIALEKTTHPSLIAEPQPAARVRC